MIYPNSGESYDADLKEWVVSPFHNSLCLSSFHTFLLVDEYIAPKHFPNIFRRTDERNCMVSLFFHLLPC